MPGLLCQGTAPCRGWRLGRGTTASQDRSASQYLGKWKRKCVFKFPMKWDCPMQRVEIRTGDDCVPRQECEVLEKLVEKEVCNQVPRQVCSYSGCEVKYETKCKTIYEIVYEDSCEVFHECPVCPELRDSYDPPSVGPYDPPSVDHYDPPTVDYYDPPSFDSYAPQDDSKSPLSKILTGLQNFFG